MLNAPVQETRRGENQENNKKGNEATIAIEIYPFQPNDSLLVTVIANYYKTIYHNSETNPLLGIHNNLSVT